MAILIVTGLVLAAAGSNVVTIVSALSSLIVGGGLVAIVTLKSRVRKASSEADEADLKVDALRARLSQQVLEDVENQLAQYRERINEERVRGAAAVQGQAEAQAKLAEAQLLLAETLEQASKERHDLRSELGAVKAENALLRRQVDDLRAEVESLRAQLDTERHGRRRDDPADPAGVA